MIIKHYGTKIPVFFPIMRALYARLMYGLGFVHTMHIYESALIMPNMSFLMHPGFIKHMNSKGVSVIVFGGNGGGSIDTEDKWQQVYNVGANGICSNSPTKLKSWLQTHPLTVRNKDE
jgi:hypothetical protein